MLPNSRELSNVEQILYWHNGAPLSLRTLKTAGRCSSIHAGLRLRLSPAMPNARAHENCSSRWGDGASTNKTLGTPPEASASSASVDPVTSSP